MFHPGLEKLSTHDLTEEEIYLKIAELNKKLGIAYGQNRDHLVIEQLTLLRDHFQMLLQEIRSEELKAEMASNPDLNWTSIDIDWPDPAEEKEKKRKDDFDY